MIEAEFQPEEIVVNMIGSAVGAPRRTRNIGGLFSGGRTKDR